MVYEDDIFQDKYLTPSTSPVSSKSSLDPCSRKLLKSASDPTGLKSRDKEGISAVTNLDRCLSLVSLLHSKVDRVADTIRVMPGPCKKCHGQTGSDHVGSKWGFNQCTLPHNDDCIGGVSGVPEVREACHIGFIPKAVQSGNDTEVSQQNYSDLSSASGTESDSNPQVSKESKDSGKQQAGSTGTGLQQTSDPVFTQAMSGGIQTSSLIGAGHSGIFTGLTSLPPLMSSGLGASSSSLLLGGAASLLGGGGPQVSGQAASLPQTTSDPSSSFLMQQFLQTLHLQQQQQQQAMMMENQRVVGEMKAAVEEAKKAARSAASVRRKSSVSFSDSLVSEAEALKALNSRDVAASSNHIGKSMNDVRKTPGLRDSVEEIMEKEVYKHSSLARTPSAFSQQQSDIQRAPENELSPSATLISALRAELAEKQKSLDSLLVQDKPKSSKSVRRAAKKAAADQAAVAAVTARAERRAASEQLAAAKAIAKQAKQTARSLGVLGVSSSSDSGTETDDESELDRTLT